MWNALEKLAVRDPETFVDYYANDVIALVAAAWLGPGYQVTSQVNVVHPGGTRRTRTATTTWASCPTRQAARFPAHVHRLSPVLTLQGAVAHSDMPVESGPTMYLPYSQQYAPGYLAWRRPEFREYFVDHHVQLPLAKGDAAFFNPALFHGAGLQRSTDIQRMANLLQVSSAFGRAMEAVDRSRTAKRSTRRCCAMAAPGRRAAIAGNAIAACARDTRSRRTSTVTSPSTGSRRCPDRHPRPGRGERWSQQAAGRPSSGLDRPRGSRGGSDGCTPPGSAARSERCRSLTGRSCSSAAARRAWAPASPGPPPGRARRRRHRPAREPGDALRRRS